MWFLAFGHYKIHSWSINNFNILLDLGILFKTVAIILFGEEKFKKEDIVIKEKAH